MPKRHFTIYSDESAKKGLHYSNFYGGLIVKTGDIEQISSLLLNKKEELNCHKEMKWTSVTENYLEKYIGFTNYFFDFVKSGRIRVRIMFTHNQFRANNLTTEQKDNEYFILYYQFIKHAFGLIHSNPQRLDRIYVSILLDQVPNNKEKFNNFKDHISGLSRTNEFQNARVVIQRDQIADVISHDHVIMQGLDILLGAIQFRLNDKHLEKPENSRKRGRRTIAKEKLYKQINRRIRDIYPNFNIGVSTGMPNGLTDRWSHPYRHWCFQSANADRDPNFIPKNVAPPEPT